jgi:hypothetical protein
LGSLRWIYDDYSGKFVSLKRVYLTIIKLKILENYISYLVTITPFTAWTTNNRVRWPGVVDACKIALGQTLESILCPVAAPIIKHFASETEFFSIQYNIFLYNLKQLLT